MTKFILIRHGKPDYSFIKNKHFKAFGNDLAFLSDEGIKKAKEVANTAILKNSELLLSSPYTRCMHTATIISNELNLPIIGEINLHEWLPDLTYTYDKKDIIYINYEKAISDYLNDIDNNTSYESMINVRKRVLEVFDKYLNYDKVVVVTHGGVIYSLIKERVSYCDTVEIDYDGKKLTNSIKR